MRAAEQALDVVRTVVMPKIVEGTIYSTAKMRILKDLPVEIFFGMDVLECLNKHKITMVVVVVDLQI